MVVKPKQRMITTEELIKDHYVRATIIIDNYLTEFQKLNKDSSKEFLEGLAIIYERVEVELAASANEAIEQSIENGLEKNGVVVSEVLRINALSMTRLSKTLNS